jgi:hypothetical protein
MNAPMPETEMSEPVSILQHRADFDAAAADVGALRGTSLANDPWVYRFAIVVLGALALLALGGDMLLTALGREAPQVTVALGSAAVGALAGLLTPVASRS